MGRSWLSDPAFRLRAILDSVIGMERASSGRRTNVALVILLPFAVLTGLLSNTIGLDWTVDPAVVHAVTALAIAVLSPWKSAIVRRGVARRRPTRWTSYALLGLIAITLISGLTHATGLTDRVGPLTIMQVHIGAGLGALALMISHYRTHPVKPRSIDLDRRSLIRTLGLTGVALAVWAGWERGVLALALPGSDRRYTGSHERSSFDQSAMPVTQWLDDRVQQIDPEPWTLEVDGTPWNLDQIATLPRDRVTAVLDCTSGWYSEQRWEGVRLDHLLANEANSFEVRSATGYARRFPMRDATALWLVTHVDGEPLTAGHGFPARIVAPGRRGFWWVKWVTEITTSDIPWWVQSPFPVT